MSPGRWQPSIVIDVQVLVTHPASVATMAREMGYPPRMIRAPDVCYLFHARDHERLPGLVDRWESYGIAAQVVLIPPAEEPSFHPGPAQRSTPRATHTRRDQMSSTADDVTEGRDQTAPASTEARGPEGTRDAPREMEAFFEEIER